MAPFILSLVAGCTSPQVPHAGDNPKFALEGAHARTPCASCHGTGTPEAQPTECIACHDADRPAAEHFAGQDCVTCHTAESWLDLIGGTPPVETDADTDADSDSDVDTDTDTEPAAHPATDETTLCGDCHEVDRLSSDHYPASDCAICHVPPTTWGDQPNGVHPVIVPHEAGEIHVCSDCHPGGDTSDFDCGTCHVAIFPHYGAAATQGDAANAACLSCHPALRN